MAQRIFLQTWYLLLLTVMLSIIMTIFVMSDPPVRNAAPWRNFHQVALLEDGYADEIQQRFKEKGIMILQQQTATVEVEDFRGRQLVTVAQLESYLEADDPRFDPFLQQLPKLFTGNIAGVSREIVYIPAADLPVSVLLRELDDIPHILVGASSLVTDLSIPSVVIVVFMTILFSKPRRWLTGFVLIPLVAYTFLSGPGGAARGGVAAVLWILFHTARSASELEQVIYRKPEPFKPVEMRYFVLFLLAATAGTGTLLWLPPGDRVAGIFTWGLFLGALLLLSRIIMLITAIRMRRNEHRLFVPHYITARETVILSGQKEVLLFLLVAMVSMPALFIAAPHPDVVQVPAPEQYSASLNDAEMLLTDLRQIALERHPLSSAGYVAHRRYQDTMFFGGTFAIPQRDEAVAITRFTREEGRIEAFEELMFRLDDPWLSSIFVSEENSVYRLFSLNEGVFVVYPKEITAVGLSPGERTTAVILLFLLGLVPVLYRLPRSRNIPLVRALDKRSDQV